MKFFVECCIKVLLEECTCQMKTFHSHLCGLAVLGTYDISSPRSQFTQCQPAHDSCKNKHSRYEPESKRPDKELAFRSK